MYCMTTCRLLCGWLFRDLPTSRAHLASWCASPLMITWSNEIETWITEIAGRLFSHWLVSSLLSPSSARKLQYMLPSCPHTVCNSAPGFGPNSRHAQPTQAHSSKLHVLTSTMGHSGMSHHQIQTLWPRAPAGNQRSWLCRSLHTTCLPCIWHGSLLGFFFFFFPFPWSLH
jgi:hypothetical protein